MDLPHGLKAIHSRHEDVTDEKVEALPLDELQAVATVVDGFDRMCCALKQDLDGGKNRSVIIDDEDARHGLPQDFVRSTEGYILFDSGQGRHGRQGFDWLTPTYWAAAKPQIEQAIGGLSWCGNSGAGFKTRLLARKRPGEPGRLASCGWVVRALRPLREPFTTP
jgi:hypothetical protein